MTTPKITGTVQQLTVDPKPDGKMTQDPVSTASDDDWMENPTQADLMMEPAGPVTAVRDVEQYSRVTVSDLPASPVAVRLQTNLTGDTFYMKFIAGWRAEYPEAVDAAKKAGLSDNQIESLFEDIVKKVKIWEKYAFQTLPAALAAGLKPPQIAPLFGKIIEKWGEDAWVVFRELKTILENADPEHLESSIDYLLKLHISQIRKFDIAAYQRHLKESVSVSEAAAFSATSAPVSDDDWMNNLTQADLMMEPVAAAANGLSRLEAGRTYAEYNKMAAEYYQLLIDGLFKGATPKNSYYGLRHGHSYSNMKGRVQGLMEEGSLLSEGLTVWGQLNTEKNIQAWLQSNPQMESAARRGDVLIVSSPFSRAGQTAEILAKALGIRAEGIVKQPNLRERDFGEFEGTDIDVYRRQVRLSDIHEPLHAGFGMESTASMSLRKAMLIRSLEGLYEGKQIVLVGHSSPLRILQSLFQKTSPYGHNTIPPFENAELRRFNTHEEPLRLENINQSRIIRSADRSRVSQAITQGQYLRAFESTRYRAVRTPAMLRASLVGR